MIVYLITNKINGKKYVGQHIGSDLKKYWYRKAWRALAGYTTGQALANAIRKYGKDAFEIKPLVIIGTKEELNYYEIGLIKSLNTKVPSGYNVTDGGEGTHGHVRTAEEKAAISRALTGRVKPNYKLMGVPRTEETKRRISEGHRGQVLSLSHIAGLRIGSHRRWHLSKGIKNPQCVLCQGVQ